MVEIKAKFLKFFAAGISGTIDELKVRQALLINVYSLICISFLLFFGFTELLYSSQQLAYAFFAEALLILLGVVLLYLTKSFKTVNWLLTISYFFLLLYTVLFSKETTIVFWLYSFPLISIMTVGRRPGAVLSILFLILVGYLLTKSPMEMPEYYKAYRVRFLASYISVFALVLFSEYIRYLTNKALGKTNLENTQYIEKINRQHEEILKRKAIFEQLQPELEKLSVVASETDNAIIITDAKGNIEWINGGFERMFGYKLPEFIAEKGGSIQLTNPAPVNLAKINQCISQKQSVSFEAKYKTKAGKVVWMKKELTPVLDKKGNIKNLISIDSDITKIKKVQQDIVTHHKEITAQKEELQLLNVEILNNQAQVAQQSTHIRASITYASTIQKASLVSSEQIKDYFDNFVIFSPKEIVSGDFYWFSPLGNNKFCFAIADYSKHGVPGAFMSLTIGELLTEIITQAKVSNPKDVIAKLLEKSNAFSKVRLQVAVVFLENIGQSIKLNSASNANMLAIYSQGEVQFIKNTEKELQKDDFLYLFTDGISLNSNLINLLSDAVKCPLVEQEKQFKIP